MNLVPFADDRINPQGRGAHPSRPYSFVPMNEKQRRSLDFNSPHRRSQRVMLKTPVVVMMRGDDNQRVAEHTRTATVNAHGALILSGLKLPVGQMVTLRNSRTEEEAVCRVVYLGPDQGQQREVGIEFMEPPRSHFWLISFPPADWTPKAL